MQRVKALDELTPADLWREVRRSDDDFWMEAHERDRAAAAQRLHEQLDAREAHRLEAQPLAGTHLVQQAGQARWLDRLRHGEGVDPQRDQRLHDDLRVPVVR